MKKTYHYDATGKLTGHTESDNLSTPIFDTLFCLFIGIPIALPIWGYLFLCLFHHS